MAPPISSTMNRRMVPRPGRVSSCGLALPSGAPASAAMVEFMEHLPAKSRKCSTVIVSDLLREPSVKAQWRGVGHPGHGDRPSLYMFGVQQRNAAVAALVVEHGAEQPAFAGPLAARPGDEAMLLGE